MKSCESAYSTVGLSLFTGYTDYEWNMTITICNSSYKTFNLQKTVVTEILSENMKAKDSIWIFFYRTEG